MSSILQSLFNFLEVIFFYFPNILFYYRIHCNMSSDLLQSPPLNHPFRLFGGCPFPDMLAPLKSVDGLHITVAPSAGGGPAAGVCRAESPDLPELGRQASWAPVSTRR